MVTRILCVSVLICVAYGQNSNIGYFSNGYNSKVPYNNGINLKPLSIGSKQTAVNGPYPPEKKSNSKPYPAEIPSGHVDVQQSSEPTILQLGQLYRLQQSGLLAAPQVGQLLGLQQTGQISAQQFEHLLLMIQSGQISAQQLGRMFGMQQSGLLTAPQVTQLLGMQQSGQISANQLEQVLGMVQSGQLSAQQLGQMFGLQQSGLLAVQQVAQLLGLQQAGQISTQQLEQLLGMVQSGQLSAQQLGQLLGLPEQPAQQPGQVGQNMAQSVAPTSIQEAEPVNNVAQPPTQTDSGAIPAGIPADLIDLARTLGVTDPSQLPSLDEAMGLLGTSSRAETIQEIRQLASTPDGLNLIRSVVGSGAGSASENVPIAVPPTQQIQNFQPKPFNFPPQYNIPKQQFSLPTKPQGRPQQIAYDLPQRVPQYWQRPMAQLTAPSQKMSPPLTTSLLSLTGIPSTINRYLVDLDIYRKIANNTSPTPIANQLLSSYIPQLPAPQITLSRPEVPQSPNNIRVFPTLSYLRPPQKPFRPSQPFKTQQDIPLKTVTSKTFLKKAMLPLKPASPFLKNDFLEDFNDPSETKQVLTIAIPDQVPIASSTKAPESEKIHRTVKTTTTETPISVEGNEEYDEITEEEELEMKPERNSPINSYATGKIHQVNPAAVKLLPFTLAKSLSDNRDVSEIIADAVATMTTIGVDPPQARKVEDESSMQ